MKNKEQFCTRLNCFFCIMKEPNSSIRTATITNYLKSIPFVEDEELVLVISELWTNAMTQPDNQELPSLGIFECMANLLKKSLHDKAWLLKNQNIYIPYYAAHIIGSYTMNKVESAVRAIDSGVIPLLLELLRGKMSWVEQRVAVRALGHLASYEKTFKAIQVYENEVVKLSMHLASSCLETVYTLFVGVEKRLRYQSDLLTRGIGGVEMENRKAEEWASQLQCWSIHLLNCFAIKERSLDLICRGRGEFLNDLCGMWGGLVNHASPGGIGLIRILCYSKVGRKRISECSYVVENVCKLSISSDDWQYMGIDCLVLLLKDFDTRYDVIEIATSYLVDLVELRSLGNRSDIGESITMTLLLKEFKHQNSKIKDPNVRIRLEEIRDLKIERRKVEQVMSREKLEEKRILAKLLKEQGNQKFMIGDIDEAILKYSEGLELCPSRYRNDRVVLHSNKAQCNLLLRDPDSAISNATRALCLCEPPNSHANSLWIRSKAFDMKGMAKESLMDCILFINACTKSKTHDRVKIPYFAVQMISKQMDSMWLFRAAQLKELNNHQTAGMMNIQMKDTSYMRGLSTIVEEPNCCGKDGSERKKVERAKGGKKLNEM
ncbi:hypothetical protein ACJIZ3_025051 [Penstemon smallii]|uniref:ARM repeat N-terminal plant domain-containing protein n=1 Tax=Penstemon smallii TaxID=265156 RepID=A0ABD3TW47_9LAMI